MRSARPMAHWHPSVRAASLAFAQSNGCSLEGERAVANPLHFMHVIRKVILLAAVVARAASAQATAHIDPLDPVYSDLRVLIGAGLVDRIVVGQLPYSRLELAGIVRQAAIRLAGSRAAENGPRLIRDDQTRFLSDLLESIRNRFDL